MNRISTLLTLLILAYSVSGQVYTEVGAMHGIDRGYGLGIFGGGISFCDFNDDGWDDLSFSTQSGDSLLFFQNNNGQLMKLPSLIPDTLGTKQILWADYDNDGDKDLFVTAVYGSNKLYNNDGFLNLSDVTESAGISTAVRNSYGAAFGDYNNDGWLDLYVCNRFADDSYKNELYKNSGNGHFELTNAFVGAQNGENPTFCMAFFDFNKDGFQDIYISNDRYFASNALLKNNGNESFSDISFPSNTNISIDAMNVGIGDYDNDGYQDIYVTNTPLGGNKLLRNLGDESFEEVSEQCNIAFFKTGWGANFLDFDNDRDLDLYVSCSNIGFDTPNSLYDNSGDGTFTEPWLLEGDTVISYANAVGDFNNDGRPDIVVNNFGPYPFMLWENQAQNTGHWLKVKLQGTTSNRDGIGTWLEFYVGGEKMIRYSHCGEAYLAQNSSNIHVGLGDFQMVDSIKIKWLSGIEDWLYNVPADQVITVVEESTVSTKNINPEKSFSIFPNPAKDQLFIQLTTKEDHEFSFEIMNVQGEKIDQGESLQNQLIELINIPPGAYYIKMNDQVQPFFIIR